MTLQHDALVAKRDTSFTNGAAPMTNGASLSMTSLSAAMPDAPGAAVALRPRTKARRLSLLQHSTDGKAHVHTATQTTSDRHAHDVEHGHHHASDRTVQIHNLSSGEDAIETVEALETGTTCAACCDTIAPDLDTILRVPQIEDFGLRLEKLLQNPALRVLNLNLKDFVNGQRLTSVFTLPPATVSFEAEPISPPATPPATAADVGASLQAGSVTRLADTEAHVHPPAFVQPHPPFEVFSAPIIEAHRMTGDGASKRVYHMSIDVSEYPLPPGEHWLVGGSFGMCAANDDATIHDLLRMLGETTEGATRPGTLRTTGGRWPTVWGDEKPRALRTTKYELLKWCSDISSSPIKKSILRVLAEYATDPLERQLLFYLVSRQGQETFCDMRGGNPITLAHLLAAFPSSKPPLAHLLSVLPQLYPRWYSLSSDPEKNHGTLEFAFTVAEVRHYLGHERPGVGSGFLERLAQDFEAASSAGADGATSKGGKPQLRLPMFRGLHANPFTKDFADTGPMILIGAGVGIAPFRGFVQRRVSSAKCADKVYVIQGCRDSQFDGIYGSDLKSGAQHCIVESQAGRKEYVQDEVVRQGELIWRVMTKEGGRTYVCGAAKGFLQGIEKALRKVAMRHGGLDEQGAKDLWKKWQDPLDLRLILEVW